MLANIVRVNEPSEEPMEATTAVNAKLLTGKVVVDQNIDRNGKPMSKQAIAAQNTQILRAFITRKSR